MGKTSDTIPRPHGIGIQFNMHHYRCDSLLLSILLTLPITSCLKISAHFQSNRRHANYHHHHKFLSSVCASKHNPEFSTADKHASMLSLDDNYGHETSLCFLKLACESDEMDKEDESLRNIDIMLLNDIASDVCNQLNMNIPMLEHNEITERVEFTSCLTISSLDQSNDHNACGMRGVNYAIGLIQLQSTKPRARHKQLKNKKREQYIVDFASMEKRLSNNKKQPQEMLIKALGSNNSSGLVVYDLTAGFGRDSAILAASPHVARVVMVERDPVVGLLLNDAVRRLKLVHSKTAAKSRDDTRKNVNKQSPSDVHIAELLASKLYFESGDGSDIIQNEEVLSRHGLPGAVYLDPMFPPRTKKAAVKKNMQILHDLLQSNDKEGDKSSSSLRLDSEIFLLKTALSVAKKRVIVKRPIRAPNLGFGNVDHGIHDGEEQANLVKPSFDVRGSTNRWDIYLV